MKFDISIIVTKFNELQLPVRYGIFGACVALIVIIDALTLMSFQAGLVKKSAEEMTKLKADIERVNIDKARLGQMRQGLDNSRQQFDLLSVKVRPVSDMPSILEEISRVASESGIKLEQLTPQKDRQEKLSKDDEPVKYFGLPVLIEARSNYHALGKFLNQLENGNLYFSLTSLSIEADDKVASGLVVRAMLKVILVEKNDSDNK